MKIKELDYFATVLTHVTRHVLLKYMYQARKLSHVYMCFRGIGLGSVYFSIRFQNCNNINMYFIQILHMQQVKKVSSRVYMCAVGIRFILCFHDFSIRFQNCDIINMYFIQIPDMETVFGMDGPGNPLTYLLLVEYQMLQICLRRSQTMMSRLAPPDHQLQGMQSKIDNRVNE